MGRAEMDKPEDGVAPVSKRLKAVSGVLLPPPKVPGPGAATVSKAASLAAVSQFLPSDAASLLQCKAKCPTPAYAPGRHEQTLGWSMDVKPASKVRALFASLPTPARWGSRSLVNDACKGQVVETPPTSTSHRPTADVVDLTAEASPWDLLAAEKLPNPTVSTATAESLNSVRAAVALAEAALAMAEAGYVDGSSSREAAAMVSAKEALGGVEFAIAAAGHT